MRLLFIPLAGGVGLGPLTRCLAVAHEARLRGHDVLFLCKDSFRGIVEMCGYKAYAAPIPPSNRRLKPPPFRLSDIAIALGWIEEEYFHSAIETERNVIRSYKPDLIFTETQFSVPVSASLENIPFVATISWADHPDFTSPLYQDATNSSGFNKSVNRILTDYGVEPIRDICELGYLGAEIKIAPTIPELQPELKQIQDVYFVGSLLSPEMENSFLIRDKTIHEESKSLKSWTNDNQVLYVYMSPGDIKPEKWIPTITEAFKDTAINVFVTLTPLNILPESLPKVPNIKFFRSVPAVEAIHKSQLVITHGGANTITSALIEGKPLMIFPDQYAERDYNGRAVERVGAGRNYLTEHFNPYALKTNAEIILSTPSYSLNSQKIGDQIIHYGGSSYTMDLIENIIA